MIIYVKNLTWSLKTDFLNINIKNIKHSLLWYILYYDIFMYFENDNFIMFYILH